VVDTAIATGIAPADRSRRSLALWRRKIANTESRETTRPAVAGTHLRRLQSSGMPEAATRQVDVVMLVDVRLERWIDQTRLLGAGRMMDRIPSDEVARSGDQKVAAGQL
jgi:hypothetical protein